MAEEKDWTSVQKINTLVSYRNFKKKYPYGVHADDADKAIYELKRIKDQKNDKNNWDITTRKNTRKAYSDYIRNNNYGKYVEDAEKKIKEIDSIKRGDIIFDGKKLGGTGSVLYSLLFPGWGQYKVNYTKAPYFIIGVASYGLVGTGGYYYTQYLINIDNYEKATQTDKIKEYRDLFEQQYSTSIYLLGAGAVIWVADIILVAIKGNKNSKEYKKKSKNYSFKPFTKYNAEVVSLGLKLEF